MTWLAEHELLFQLLTVALVVALIALVVRGPLPGMPRLGKGGRHRGFGRALPVEGHTPRYHRSAHRRPHRTSGRPAALGRTPDGDLVLTNDAHEPAGVAA